MALRLRQVTTTTPMMPSPSTTATRIDNPTWLRWLASRARLVAW